MRNSVKIAVENLRPGSHLANDILDDNGACLIRAGVKLTQTMITRLIDKGITDIFTIAPQHVTVECDGEIRHDLELALNQRFRKVEGYPLMMALKKAVLEARVRQESGC